MATGKHPYAGTSGPQLIARILDQAPSPPTSRNRKLSPILEAIILKAMDRDPDRRYQSAREMRIDLERLSTGSTRISDSSPNGMAMDACRRLFALIVALLIWNPADIRGRIAGSRLSSISHGRRSVAVVGFRNLSGKPEQAWLSTALSEMLSTELANAGQLRALPGENIARMKLDLALPDAGELRASTRLSRIRKHSGTDLVVLGSYMAMGSDAGDRIRIDFHLQDAATGETLASVSETGTGPELLDSSSPHRKPFAEFARSSNARRSAFRHTSLPASDERSGARLARRRLVGSCGSSSPARHESLLENQPRSIPSLLSVTLHCRRR